MTRRLKVVVCGTAFGQVYLEGLRHLEAKYELVGVHARGSARSEACAEHYGVPLLTDLDDVDADVACVIVRGGLLGGAGSDMALRLMARGVHVLQEHPLHHDELAACLAQARKSGVIYQLNTFYADLPAVRRFLAAAHELTVERPPVCIDAMTGFQVAYALLDIIGAVLGRLRPYSFSAAPHDGTSRPFRSLDGRIGGVPVTIRIENRIDPADPDSRTRMLHRISVGTDSGDLTLVTSVGPIVWSARPGIPGQVRDAGAAPLFAGLPLSGGGASARVIGPATAPDQEQVFGSLWPRTAARALDRLHDAVLTRADPLRRGQYYLALCQMWQGIAAQLGPPELMTSQPRLLTDKSRN